MHACWACVDMCGIKSFSQLILPWTWKFHAGRASEQHFSVKNYLSKPGMKGSSLHGRGQIK